MPDGQLLLAVAIFGIILVDFKPLDLHGGDDGIHHLGCGSHSDRRKTQAVVQRGEAAIRVFSSQGKLIFESGLYAKAFFSAGRDLAFQEGPRACLPRAAIMLEHIHCHSGRPGRVRQHYEGVRVGHQAYFPHRAHPFHSSELVEHVHRLHCHCQADAVAHAVMQILDARGFPTRYAAIVGVQEPHQTHPRFFGFCDDALDLVLNLC